MSFTDILHSAQNGATILTATRRLSRELIQQFDQAQLDTGKVAWTSADILPWDAWLRRCWQELSPTLENAPILLSDSQLDAIWQQVVAEDIKQFDNESQPLWNIQGSASAGIDAYRLLTQWCIRPEQFSRSTHQDHRCFIRWLRSYQSICQKKHWIDGYHLTSYLIAHSDALIVNAHGICLAGFDSILPEQRQFLDNLENTGHSISILPFDHLKPSITGYQYTDVYAEWLAAGQWAREIIEQSPHSRIAIVAPDLAKSKDPINYALKQTLCPAEIISPGDQSKLPFHISLGDSLSKQPCIKAALNLLTVFSNQHVTISALQDMVQSPYIHGAEKELIARATFAAEIGKALPIESGYRQVLERLAFSFDQYGDDHCYELRQLLERVDDFIKEAPKQAGFNFWSHYFSDLLTALGWPREQQVASDTYQAMTAFHEQLRKLGELDLTLNQASMKNALNWLTRRVKSKTFQIENDHTQIEVVGIAEAAGLHFDYLWFGGATESDWPAAARPNPFIPIRLQRDAGIIRASVELNMAYSKKQFERLLSSAQTIVVSHSQLDHDISIAPSSLIQGISFSEETVSPETIAQKIYNHAPQIESFEDCAGPPLVGQSTMAGGSSLLAMQSLCPLGAFARFRLGAQSFDQNEPGLDALERGSLLHSVLELVWTEIKTSEQLHCLDQETLESIIVQCGRKVSRRYQPSSGFGTGFFKSLERWISTTLLEWFEIERQRAEPFEVLSLEQKVELGLSNLNLRLMIDRVDRLSDGSVVLIDYKTGAQNSVNGWLAERPDAPQLPLYALTQDQRIEAVVYAQVKLGQCAYIGLSDQLTFGLDSARDIRVPQLEKKPDLVAAFGDWIGLMQFWDQALNMLAAEFVAGDARIDPGGNSICRFCTTPAFCRSGDRPEMARSIEADR